MAEKLFSVSLSFLLLSVALCQNSYAENITVGDDIYSVKWIAKDNFNNSDWRKRWHPEPENLGTVSEGKLVVKGTGTIWFKQELPKNVFIWYTTRASSGKSNFNNFFSASEPDGLEVEMGKRNGLYSSYFGMNLYAITYTTAWTRLWRAPDREKHNNDPGRYKKSECLDGDNGFYAARNNETYIVVITVFNGRIRYYINGKIWHDWIDQLPHNAGKYAIRTWKTNAIWDDFAFGEIATVTNDSTHKTMN